MGPDLRATTHKCTRTAHFYLISALTHNWFYTHAPSIGLLLIRFLLKFVRFNCLTEPASFCVRAENDHLYNLFIELQQNMTLPTEQQSYPSENILFVSIKIRRFKNM